MTEEDEIVFKIEGSGTTHVQLPIARDGLKIRVVNVGGGKVVIDPPAGVVLDLGESWEGEATYENDEIGRQDCSDDEWHEINADD